MRYYQTPNQYRVGFDSRLPTGIKWLLIANVIVFLLELFDSSRMLIDNFGLIPNAVLTGPLVYQVVTYMFLHSPSSFLHIFFNMLMLWMFGSEVERFWGTRKFIRFYMFTGTVAGIFTVMLTPHSTVPVIGASGAVLGVLIAFAALWPDRKVYLYFLIPVRVKYLMMFIVGMDLVLAFSRSGDNIAHWTHLGGALFGLLYMKGGGIPGFFRKRMLKIRSYREDRKSEKMQANSDKLMDDVDRILDKINEVGINNLSEKERKILERASSQLSKKRR
jgi:membrane associated rhomboid family serine protease